MRTKSLSLLLPTALMTFLVAAPAASADLKHCSGDHICSKGEICLSSRCFPGCRTSSQCQHGEICRRNSCTRQVCTPGVPRACYEGPEGTKNVGMCKSGIQYCNANGRGWSSCMGQRLPRRETCNREDDDCDGKVDNGIQCDCTPGAARRCYTGPRATVNVGLCRPGMQYCDPDHHWGPCVGQTRPKPESCDGVDNDCDGRVDEGIVCDCKAGAVRECYTHDARTAGKGTCHRGHQACGIDHRWSACYGQQGPEKEVCGDRKDNDCDGAVDEGCFAGLTPVGSPTIARRVQGPRVRPLGEAARLSEPLGTSRERPRTASISVRMESGSRREASRTLSRARLYCGSDLPRKLEEIGRQLESAREQLQSIQRTVHPR